MKVDAVILHRWQYPCYFLSVYCSGEEVYAVSHKVHAVCCDGGYSANEGGCSVPAVLSVPQALS